MKKIIKPICILTIILSCCCLFIFLLLFLYGTTQLSTINNKTIMRNVDIYDFTPNKSGVVIVKSKKRENDLDYGAGIYYYNIKNQSLEKLPDNNAK